MSAGENEEADLVPDIPPEAIERWLNLPSEKQLVFRLTKQDFDNLLLSIRTGIISQTYLASAMQKLSQGNIDEANKDFNDGKECIQKSLIWINSLISSIMTNAMVVEDDTNG